MYGYLALHPSRLAKVRLEVGPSWVPDGLWPVYFRRKTRSRCQTDTYSFFFGTKSLRGKTSA